MTSNRTLLFTLFGVFLGLLAGAVMALVAARPRGAPVELLPAPSPAPLLVDVSGAVRLPGVYPLAVGSRVQDAIQAAGGLAEDANRDGINLAAHIRDGDKINIPRQGEAALAPLVQRPADPPAAGDKAGPQATEPPTGPVNLNTATLEELQSLPGIGASRAQQIIDYRQEHGGFKAIEEIQNIPGIGPATFEKMKDRLTIQ